MRSRMILRRAGAALALALLVGAGGTLSACGALSITERCHRAYPKGTEGYRDCVRKEQAEAERIRQRASRQFPSYNLP